MAVTTDTPVVVPAQPEVTYEKVWFPMIRIMAPECNGDADVMVSFRMFRTKEDNTNEFAPTVAGQPAEKLMNIRGLMSKSDFTSEDSLTQQAALAALLSDSKTTLPILMALAQQAIFTTLATYGKTNGHF